MEVPGQGVESELQLLAYTTAIATLDPLATEWGQGLNPYPHGHYVRFLTHWATMETLSLVILVSPFNRWGPGHQSFLSLLLSLIFATPPPVSSLCNNQRYLLKMSSDLISPMCTSFQWPPTAFGIKPLPLPVTHSAISEIAQWFSNFSLHRVTRRGG